MARLGDIATYINGYAFKPTDWSSEGVPIIRIQDLTGNSYQANRFNGEYDSKYEVNYGDVLISWSASLGVYVWTGEKAVLNQHIFKVQFDKAEVDKNFFVHQVECILNNASGEAHGATMKHLTKPVFDALPFYLPNIEEQKKIANELEKVSNLISLRKQQFSKLDELVKSRFVELFGDFIERTSSVDFESICEFVTVGIANSATHAFCDDGVIMFRNQNIKEDYLDTSDIVNITPDFASKYKSKMLKKDDLLIVRTGYPGVACLVPEQYEGCQTFTTLIARLKNTDIINPRFVCHYINSEYGKKYVKDNSAGAAQQNFGATALSKLPVCIPPIELQAEYIRFVEQTDKSKLAIQQSLETLETLKKALMQKYFG